MPSESLTLQKLYDFLRVHQALERAQEILSPLRLPEELTIKMMEGKAINAWYKQENFKPSVTICYELLKHILNSLPNETGAAASVHLSGTVACCRRQVFRAAR